jgi:TolB-like protein/DNA-binding winged helix-turn-helix (wHTH) protein/Tfp pilus assembly protein PilF
LPENERMDRLGSADILLFEGFRLDRSSGGLFRLDQGGSAAPVALGSRALDLLGLLVERQGQLVSKDAIMEAVWPGMVVEEGNLTVQISTLRRVLDQDREERSCIQTVPGRGYRFVAPVTRVEPVASPVSVRTSGNGSSGPIAENRDPQDPSMPGQPPSMPAAAAQRDRHRLSRGIMAAVIGALGLFAVVAAGNWHLPWSGEARSVPRLSIVVLPFTDLSGDPGQGYIADGVTDDLTTDLSRIADMFVISRNTAFTYRNKPVDAKQIGRELGVRYVLDGSVRRSGNQVRVNAQLIDAETDAHLWAERFDRDAGDLFALQDEITSRIAVALNLELIDTEAARPTDDPDALDYILRGRAGWAKAPTRDNYREVIGLFERALARDPRSVEAQSLLATALANRVLDYMSGSTAADIERAEELTGQALAASPRSPLAHWAKGQLLTAKFRYDEAIPEYEMVIAFNRNSADAYSNLGWCKLYTGSIEETISLQEQAVRLSPRDPSIGFWYWRIGVAHLLQSRTAEAIVWLEKARSANPGLPVAHAYLASAYALKGDTERASGEFAEAQRLSDNHYPTIASLKAGRYFGVPKIRALYETTFFVGLRKAGMPEE